MISYNNYNENEITRIDFFLIVVKSLYPRALFVRIETENLVINKLI